MTEVKPKTKTYSTRERVKAIVLMFSTLGVLIYQAYLHNYVLKLMYGWEWSLAFWVADVVLGLSFILWIWEAHATILRIRRRQKNAIGFLGHETALEATSACKDVAGPLTTWVLYIILVITKTGFIFYGYTHEHEQMLKDPVTTGDMKWALMMIGGVFLLETWSNDNALPNAQRETFLYAASTGVFFDLFDAAEIMDFWFGDKQVNNLQMIRFVALAFHCICLVFPIFTVASVHSSRYGIVPINTKYEFAHKMARSVVINLPFLVLRSIDAYHQKVDVGQITYVTKALIAKNLYILLSTFIPCISKKYASEEA